MESLTLFVNNKERKLFFLSVFVLFTLNLLLDFYNYKKLIKNEVSNLDGTILNIYYKQNYNTVKIKTKDFTFFTSINKTKNLKIFDAINLYIITDKVTFISYLKGFYAKSFDINTLDSIKKNKQKIYTYITSQHNSNDISSLYNALYLATPLSTSMRTLANNLGISHLIAISGFHLSVISLVLYFIIHLIYNYIHKHFYPYRNKKYDITIAIGILLCIYLIFIDSPPSLLRALVMFVFALFLIRNNIKIVSFETLLIISIVIISMFPNLLFSLSLWFSIIGVFYIFLFIKYFNHLNKIIQFILFNFWLYLTINPITHYFFPTVALEQLYSPILTVLFTLFYPLSVILHLFNMGGVFDIYIENFNYLEIYNVEVYTPDLFFIFYILISLVSVVKKEVFILLNISMICFNLWLFHFVF